MKKVYKNSIENIPRTDIFDNTFVFEYLENPTSEDTEIMYLRDLLEKYKNEDILKKTPEKPAMYSEVYSPKIELQIFTELFEKALKNNKKIHIVWVTLGEEIQMLEKYYQELWFMRKDINAFDVDFSVPLVTVSCHIENLMWKGSDYKAQRDKIFFCPPIRESGQNKALFKWITRGVIAGVDMSHSQLTPNPSLATRGELTQEYQQFLGDCIRQEKILPLFMGRILKYNLEEVGFGGKIEQLQIKY